MKTRDNISQGENTLGIEFGSTRIKAVLLDFDRQLLASGEHCWENRLDNGIWTYSLDDIWSGVQDCYAKLKSAVKQQYDVTLTKIGAIGISAMMHGYRVFDKNNELLTLFRTWRNNNAEPAAKKLTELFGYPIPARWSIAHLYQAIRDNEKHITQIDFQTTLAGYIHYKLTGENVIGIGEASGMFPIDLMHKNYNQKYIDEFNSLDCVKKQPWKLQNILPKVLSAGESAGSLTKEGSKLLDPDGDLEANIPLCPPDGDAGTGMIATNSIKKATGNVSVGTSIFSMVVLEKELKKVHPEIDLITTPDGYLVAMVHCNNCTSDINAWVNVFDEFADLLDSKISKNELFEKLFIKSLEGDTDCGGILSCNYLSGENITNIDEGRPTVLRTPMSKFNLANLMRSHIYAAFATLKIGTDILLKEENVTVNELFAHGGIFKTENVAQQFLAAAVNSPVTVNDTANEGGAWGIAVLAIYMLQCSGQTLSDYLDRTVFANVKGKTVLPNNSDVIGFDKYTERFKKSLPVIREAVTALKE